MTSRERIMLALRGKTPDRIPWTPCIEGYYLSTYKEPINSYDAVRAFGGDIMERRVYVYKEKFKSTTVSEDENGNKVSRMISPKGDIEVINKIVNGTYTNTTITPVGTIEGEWVYNENTAFIPFPTKHRMQNIDDIKVLKYFCENIDFEPTYENFTEADKAIGDDGIATVLAIGSPFHDLLEGDFGVENCYYMLYDYKKEMEELMEVMHHQMKKAYAIIAKCPAEVVIGYENTSTTTMSPEIYEKYCEQPLNDYADMMHDAGKIYLTHMCGKLKGLTKQLARGRMDGIVDIAPAPTGDMTLAEAKKAFPGKIVMGGIDATEFIGMTPDQMDNYVKGILHDCAPGDKVFLGSGDAMPKGAPLDTLKAVTEAVRKYGVMPLKF